VAKRLKHLPCRNLASQVMQAFSVLVLTLSIAIVVMLALQSNAATVSRDQIEAAVRQHVEQVASEKGLTSHGGVLSVSFLKLPDVGLNFPDTEDGDDVQLQVESSLKRFFSMQTLVRVLMTCDDHSRQIGVPIRITLNKPVWVVKNPIMSGQTISKADLVLERQDITSQFDKIVDASFPVELYAARLMLQPSWVLSTNHLNRPPVVRRNHPVKMVLLGDNGLKVQMEGNCLEDGHMGQRVRVRHATLRDRYYSAVVTGDNQVTIQL